jgi:predicted ATPase
MPQLPAGTVTLLFTDIEGSTSLLRELGDDYAAVLAEHGRLFRSAFAPRGGVEVDTQGDAFFVAFSSARAALDAALDAQRALASTRVRVRMGMHTGEPKIAGERYVGLDVVLAARICAATHGGQIVLSQATRELVDRELRDLGDHRLKDIAEPVRLYQVSNEDFPPLRTLNWTNLPLPQTPLIGRETEVLSAIALLRREDVRLVTLTGTGGTGKTRLALEVAAEVVSDFEDGVFWVPLAGVEDARLVVSTVAGIVGAKRGLEEYLGDRQILLALDNFEQVVGAAADVSALLRTCPNLRILVTSREPLHVGGEHEFPVPVLTEEEAIRLFHERAEAVRPGFSSDGAVAEICHRLDLLPLAIELAAARTKVLDAGELLTHLQRRLPLLISRRRDVPERQRTLRGTIAWSYELLDPDEQRLFRSLSIFAGGGSLESAMEVCAATLVGLESLVDKSLLWREQLRFHMLETIREYARDRLENDESAKELGRLHAEHFCHFGERAEPELEGPDQAVWLDAVAQDLDNVRAALEWCFSDGDPELGARLASSLDRFWFIRGYLIEERNWLDRALARTSESPWLETKVLKVAAGNAWQLSDFDRMRDLTTQRLGLARERGDRREVGRCLNNLGLIARQEEDFPRAASLYRESIALLRELGEPIDTALGNLGRVAMLEGDFEQAEAYLSEGLALARDRGNIEQVVNLTRALSLAHIHRGRLSEAVALQREVLRLAVQLEYRFMFVTSCELLAIVLAQCGNFQRAAQLFGKAQAITEELGMTWEPERQAPGENADTLIRSGLSEEARLEGLRVGRDANVRELLEIALGEAAMATESQDA